jgi:hypothetical protein
MWTAAGGFYLGLGSYFGDEIRNKKKRLLYHIVCGPFLWVLFAFIGSIKWFKKN